MDACYTGKMILELRKQRNMTQKELAEKLHVTDKAVSKWERGLNFPEITSLEKLSVILNTSVIELLGLEDNAREDIVLEMSALSKEEKNRICRGIWGRGWYTVIFCIIAVIALGYVDYVLPYHEIFEIVANKNMIIWPDVVLTLARGCCILTIANGVYSILKSRKIMG